MIRDSETTLSDLESRIGTIEQRIFELECTIADAHLRECSAAPAERLLHIARKTRSVLLLRREAVQDELAQGGRRADALGEPEA